MWFSRRLFPPAPQPSPNWRAACRRFPARRMSLTATVSQVASSVSQDLKTKALEDSVVRRVRDMRGEVRDRALRDEWRRV